jgi:molybdopterin synthase catalytic subunit
MSPPKPALLLTIKSNPAGCRRATIAALNHENRSTPGGRLDMGGPSFDSWLAEIKSEPDSSRVGMYLMHNGVVRGTTRAGEPVTGMELSYDPAALQRAVESAKAKPGINAVRVWMNEGRLSVGDDIMRVLVAGDIREHVLETLTDLVRTLKTECAREWEIT